jgi:hypothetical protein
MDGKAEVLIEDMLLIFRRVYMGIILMTVLVIVDQHNNQHAKLEWEKI